MTVADEIVTEIFVQDHELPEILAAAIKQKLGMSIGEFSEKSGIPASTLYKILSGERDPNMRTFRRILTTVREIKRGSSRQKKFIAVIGARGVLDGIEKDEINFNNETIEIKEYAVTTIEEAIIAAIHAERDGASALVCAPIVSPTVERIVTIPVATIRPTASVTRAIELAAKKIS
ncbi:MAG: helix-turn-helix domain-containing protein [Methanophagales archaeon ANME-1-THS]|nr:MAG: helix-turn-helix domain-containing protein [Methanophagales archaeon ANME-1-THS]